jgi:hypothetical protein
MERFALLVTISRKSQANIQTIYSVGDLREFTAPGRIGGYTQRPHNQNN